MSSRVQISEKSEAVFILEAIENEVGRKQAEISNRFLSHEPLDEATRQKLIGDYEHYNNILLKYRPRFEKVDCSLKFKMVKS
jgi:hypothetical protein